MLCTLIGTPEELFQRLYALALRLLDETIRRRAGDETNPFLMAKQFMEKQYMDNISLERVASIAGFSPNYFSSQFKQETGMGFQDYLTMLRINRAKELLRMHQSVDLRGVLSGRISGYPDIQPCIQARGRTPAGRVQKALWYIGRASTMKGGGRNAGEEKAIQLDDLLRSCWRCSS